MGEDPNKLSFNEGTPCITSGPILGISPPPAQMLLTFTDMLGCGTLNQPSAPGAKVVTQLVAPLQCHWRFSNAQISIVLELDASPILDVIMVTPPFSKIFTGTPLSTTVVNTLICGPGDAVAFTGGQAIISWGPDI